MKIGKMLPWTFFTFLLGQKEGLDGLTLDGKAEQETISFFIKNTGLITENITFIVIQDNILIKENGEDILQPGQVKEIVIDRDFDYAQHYKIQVNSVSGSGEKMEPAKNLILEG